MRGAPYRDPPTTRQPKPRTLDPWYLALLFAWVCDAWRIAAGVVDRHSVTGEIGFAGVLAVITLVVVIVRVRSRRR